jgi:hypothetical protein
MVGRYAKIFAAVAPTIDSAANDFDSQGVFPAFTVDVLELAKHAIAAS